MTDIQTPVSSSPGTSPVAVETGPSASVGGVDGGQVVGPPHLPAVDLTRAEADLLAACEATIERGLRTFVETGSALADIRDNRLYRAEFPTFAVYCAQRWGLSAAHVNRLISKDAVAELISTPTGAKINERQARELAPLLGDPTELADVYAEAVNRSGGNPTAAVIREVRDERTTDTPASPPAPVAADENGPSSPPGGIDETSTDPRTSSVDPTAGSGAGKSAGPADPDAKRPPIDLDDADAAREDQFLRTSRTFEEALANMWLVLDPDPIAWLVNRYRPNYPLKDLPRVRDAFTVTGLRALSKHLDVIADHLDQTGATL